MIAHNYINDDNSLELAIFDRCVDELITFAQVQFELGNLTAKEFFLYRALQQDLVRLSPGIDLYIYCHCTPETSLQRIIDRGRIFEKGITLDYIKKINLKYDEWLQSLPRSKIIYISTDKAVDYKSIAAKISHKLFSI